MHDLLKRSCYCAQNISLFKMWSMHYFILSSLCASARRRLWASTKQENFMRSLPSGRSNCRILTCISTVVTKPNRDRSKFIARSIEWEDNHSAYVI